MHFPMKLIKTIIIQSVIRNVGKWLISNESYGRSGNTATFLEALALSSFKIFIHIDSTFSCLGIFT